MFESLIHVRQIVSILDTTLRTSVLFFKPPVPIACLKCYSYVTTDYGQLKKMI